jgi:signal transduction histidine kinase
VLREYHLLGGVLLSFVIEELRASGVSTSAVEAVELVSRLHQAVDVLSQATVEAFVGLYTRTIADQSERLDQLTRVAAHEWRQPLGVLQFGVGVLRRPDVNPQVIDRTLASVERSVQHLVDLTRKLETMARVRSDGDNAVVQTVSVTTIAQEAARQLREMSDARDVTLSVAEDMPTVTVDVGRLELAFVNLLSNAIKYSDPDKDERRVEVVGAVADDGSARIEVRDNGIGIPDAALTTIFERFTRAHANQADLLHIGGIGLGLSIVSDCVRAMRGSIEVRSVERQGTTFIVTLPAAESAPVIN